MQRSEQKGRGRQASDTSSFFLHVGQRSFIASVGTVPAGTYVLADGRLGVVLSPTDDPWRPNVQVGGEIFVPKEPVQLFSPVANAQVG